MGTLKIGILLRVEKDLYCRVDFYFLGQYNLGLFIPAHFYFGNQLKFKTFLNNRINMRPGNSKGCQESGTA